ncbi:MAG: hypothetical protein K2N18_00365, partial [Clostridia bacterium]|nr:hypothetical protein [Clostridia bacterium]
MKRKVFSVVCLAIMLVLTVCLAACNPRNHKTYRVTAEYDSAQGTVVISNSDGIERANFRSGEKAVIKVTPSRGYSVDTFTVNAEEAQLENGEYTLNVRKDTVVKVTFEKKNLIPLSVAALNSVKTTLKIEGVYVYQIEGGSTDI